MRSSTTRSSCGAVRLTSTNLQARQSLYAEPRRAGSREAVALPRVASGGAAARARGRAAVRASSPSGSRSELGAEVTLRRPVRADGRARTRRVGSRPQVGDVQRLPFRGRRRSTRRSRPGCSTTSRISTAGLGELARVLDPGGRLVAVTNAERPSSRAPRRDRLRLPTAQLLSARTARTHCSATFGRSRERIVDGTVTVADARCRASLPRLDDHVGHIARARVRSAAARTRPASRSSSRSDDPPGRVDPAEARRRGARRRRARRA